MVFSKFGFDSLFNFFDDVILPCFYPYIYFKEVDKINKISSKNNKYIESNFRENRKKIYE